MLDTVSKARQGYDYQQTPLLLRNDRGQFTDVSHEAGPPFLKAGAGRGAAVGDLDNDGDLDLVIANLHGAPAVIRNDSGGHSLRVRLRGTRSNRDGLGAILVMTDAEGRKQRAICSTASSYQSASDGRVHFGLGTSTAARLDVHWPSGVLQTVSTLPPRGSIDVHEPAATASRELGGPDRSRPTRVGAWHPADWWRP